MWSFFTPASITKSWYNMYLPYSVKYGKITITHMFQIIQSYLILLNPTENFHLCVTVREVKVLRMPICKMSFLKKKTFNIKCLCIFLRHRVMLQFDVSSVNVTIINDFLISVVEMFYKLNIFQWNWSTTGGQVPLCLPAELSAGLWIR